MNRQRRVAEFRANIKSLEEQRAELQDGMQQLLDGAKAETRAMSDDEQSKFDDFEKKIKGIDATIEAEKRAAKLRNNVKITTKEEKTAEQRAEAEERAFENLIRNNIEELRSGEIQLTQGNNGSIVPKTIANRIIKKVRDMVPYLTLADVINTNGELAVPVYGEDATNYINADYVDEGTDLTDNIGKFTTVSLTGYVIGALSLVSKKLINNNDLDIVSFVIDEVARAMAEKLETEFTVGTTGKITGITSTTNTITTAASTAVTYDELVSLKHKLKKRFRKDARWIMNDDTYTAICKLKDANGQPYFNDDDYEILGRPVEISDSMPGLEAGKKAIVFADLSGYTIKCTTSIEIQVLLEKYATKNMIGVVSFGEFDAKITDAKKIAALTMKTA